MGFFYMSVTILSAEDKTVKKADKNFYLYLAYILVWGSTK